MHSKNSNSIQLSQYIIFFSNSQYFFLLFRYPVRRQVHGLGSGLGLWNLSTSRVPWQLNFCLPGNTVVDLLFSPFFVSLTFIDIFIIAWFSSRFCTFLSINTHGWRNPGMVILWLYIAVSGSFCRACSVQLAPIRDAASERWWKYVPFWNRCTTALFGFLTAVYIPSEEL